MTNIKIKRVLEKLYRVKMSHLNVFKIFEYFKSGSFIVTFFCEINTIIEKYE